MPLECCEEKKRTFFPFSELREVQKKILPRHVAIIMDGNRRWEAKHFFSKHTSKDHKEGHWAGAKTLVDIVEGSLEIGIEVLTVFGFSTENWGRSQLEINLLFNVFESYLRDNRQRMVDQGVRFDVIGELSRLPLSIKNEIAKAKEATKNGTEMDFIIAYNYGGRDELKRAIKKIAEDCCQKKISPEEITEGLIGNYLDTHSWADPDLLIRTSGELRISNFLLWQLAYAEIYMTEVLWPDFTPDDLLKAVKSFQGRQRRLGK